MTKLTDEEILKAIAFLAHKEKIHVNDASKLSQGIRQLMEERDKYKKIAIDLSERAIDSAGFVCEQKKEIEEYRESLANLQSENAQRSIKRRNLEIENDKLRNVISQAIENENKRSNDRKKATVDILSEALSEDKKH